MRRIAVTFVAAAGGYLLFVQDAVGMHNVDHRDISSGVQAGTVALWAGFGVGIVLLATWLFIEGRRHHWHPLHKPVHMP